LKFIWLLAAVCVVFLWSCGGTAVSDEAGSQTPRSTLPTIRFAYCWTHGFDTTINAYRKQVKDSFNLETEANNGIQHKTQIFIDVASNNLPDVFTFWSYDTNLKYFVDNNLIVDAQELFDASDFLKREDFRSEALAATEIDGRNYALPYEWFQGVFIVNKKILDESGLALPRTLDDIVRMTPVLRKRGIVPLSMGSYLGDPGHLFFSALTYQTPGAYRDTVEIRKTGNFIYPGTRTAADAVLKLVKAKAVPENTIQTGSWDYQVNQFNLRKTAMTYTFNWTFALFDPQVAAESVIIPVPRISEASEDPARFTVGGVSQSICVSRAAWKVPEKRKSIIRFLEWLFSDATFIARAGQEGCEPTRKIRLPDSVNPLYKKAKEALSGVKTYPLHEFCFGSLATFDRYKAANDLLWSGAVSSDEFLRTVQEELRTSHD